MQVILVDEVPNLGDIGDVASVKPGYARNYLLPRGLAIPASLKNRKRLEHEKRIAFHRLIKVKRDAAAIAKRLSAVSVTIARKVGEQDKLYGSVTGHDVHKALKDSGVEVERRRIQLDEPIKALGVYQVPIRLQNEVTAEVKVWVVAE